jgi:hypothetical protein
VYRRIPERVDGLYFGSVHEQESRHARRSAQMQRRASDEVSGVGIGLVVLEQAARDGQQAVVAAGRQDVQRGPFVAVDCGAIQLGMRVQQMGHAFEQPVGVNTHAQTMEQSVGEEPELGVGKSKTDKLGAKLLVLVLRLDSNQPPHLHFVGLRLKHTKPLLGVSYEGVSALLAGGESAGGGLGRQRDGGEELLVSLQGTAQQPGEGRSARVVVRAVVGRAARTHLATQLKNTRQI